ncbi:MAG: triose-phosphate isomerase [Gammaproteobacteria bacterium]
MRKPLVVGNWKMNGTVESSGQLLQELRDRIDAVPGQAEIGVCVPYLFIPLAQEILKGSRILLGAQNVADQSSGAFTGEISAGMLKEYNCRLAIVGHSERRLLYGESDELVAARFKYAVEGGLVPILCLGETLEQREAGATLSTVVRQLDAVIALCGVQSLHSAVIAYEPVWAIGTGRTATSDQAQEVHDGIRNKIAGLDKAVARGLRILYGGSVKPDNAAELFSMPDIDGGLIGGASLDAESFLKIYYSA